MTTKTKITDKPFAINFVTSNEVGSDQSNPQTIELAFSNVKFPNESDCNVEFIHSTTPAEASELRIAVEVGGDEKYWALNAGWKLQESNFEIGTSSNGLIPNPSSNNGFIEEKGLFQWSFVVDPDKEIWVLDAQKYIRVLLMNIWTDKPAGDCVFYVWYKNLPRYVDGCITATLKKNP